MATSTLRDTKCEILTADELKEVIKDLCPIQDITEWTVSDALEAITEDLQGRVLEALIELIAPAVMPAASLAFTVLDVIELLQDTLKWAEMRSYLEKMTDNSKRFKITIYYYEWLSGSENHTGYYAEEKYSHISEKIKPHQWEKLPWRWVVERTFGWMNSFRRLSKDYEISISSEETMVKISHSATLLKRL